MCVVVGMVVTVWEGTFARACVVDGEGDGDDDSWIYEVSFNGWRL